MASRSRGPSGGADVPFSAAAALITLPSGSAALARIAAVTIAASASALAPSGDEPAATAAS